MPPETDSPEADVTVIIPAYRAAETIGRALDSVAGQTLRPRAVVVVDDGSNDGTEDAARSWRDPMDHIHPKVISQPNAGPGAARNRAIATSRTTYLAFLDADDEWLPGKLERSMVHMEAGDYVLVAHDSLAVDGNHKTRIDCARRFRDAAAAPFVGLYRKGFIDTGTVVVRRDAVLAAGGFDTRLPNGQDFELWLALLKAPDARFLVFDEVLAHYHFSADGIMSHVERRRRCCMEIAGRYVFDLKNHPGLPLMSLGFRTIAVHYEAVMAHLARGARDAALGAAARLPGSLLMAGLSYLLGRCPVRHPGLP